MYWIFYSIASILVAFILANTKERYFYLIFITTCCVFLTPTTVTLNGEDLAPAIFTYLYCILFEQDYSFRPIRPLVLTLPTSLILLYLLGFIKRKFFQRSDYLNQ